MTRSRLMILAALVAMFTFHPGCSDSSTDGGGDTGSSSDTDTGSETAVDRGGAGSGSGDETGDDGSGDTPDETGTDETDDDTSGEETGTDETGDDTDDETGDETGDATGDDTATDGEECGDEVCPGSHACIDDECVPILCQPGQVFCEGFGSTKECNDDGTGFQEAEPCPEGWYCTSGKCTDTCLSDPKFGSHIGCSYWTVDLPNWPDPTIFPTNPEDLPHALVIANPNELETEITFEPPDGVVVEIDDPVVPAGESKVFMMPVINTEGSDIAKRAIRFSATRPILAHQFNPWKAIWSNDASLLLPESRLGQHYVVHSWPTDPRGLITFPGLPSMENVNGFFTVVAAHNETTVTVQVTGRVAAGEGVDAMAPGELQFFELGKGDVLNIECEPESIWETCDLTGSTVSGTQPIAVFAGHESAGIANPNVQPSFDPEEEEGNGCCLDHLEEQMLPREILGQDYACVKSKPRGNDPDLWRIVAAEDGITLVTDPPVGALNGAGLQKRGDWIEVYTEESFELYATGKVQVGQYFIGQESTDQGTGDPSLMLQVPLVSFRDSYVLTVPPGYDTNWMTIIRVAGASVSTDAGPIPDSEFAPFGSGDWEFTYIELPAGVHKLTGDEPFGVLAYGYNGAMSYGYTGGMD